MGHNVICESENDSDSTNCLGHNIECYVTTAELLRPRKKAKTEHVSAISLAFLWSKKYSTDPKDLTRLKVLFDSGSSATLINRNKVRLLHKTKTEPTRWSTKAGSLKTTRKCKIKFSLPEFHEGRDIEWNVYVDDNALQQTKYDMIIGRDLMEHLGFDIMFSEKVMCWDNATAPMRSVDRFDNDEINYLEQEILSMNDPDTIGADRIQEIIDAKYSPADLEAVTKGCKELTVEEQVMLYNLLQKFAPLFDGSLGNWSTEPVDIELKDPNATPYHAKPYPVPYSQEQKLRQEVERLVLYGVLRKINRSEWASPMFTIKKPDDSLRSLADLRELNKRIKRKPFPLPKITDLLLKLEGFMWATSLDLNMGYYHIVLTPNASRLCTIVLPWGKYEYLRLPMGLCNSPDIFQEKMSELMTGLEFVRAYLDDLLIISKGSFKEHLDHLEQVLTRLQTAGLKINATKSTFCSSELKYLGYVINRKGILPHKQKVDAILQMKEPENRRALRRFLGMVNYYRDMWPQRSEILAPLTGLTSKKVKWKWTEECSKAFKKMLNLIAEETLLTYPNFQQPFDVHTDASKLQLGACISQEGKPIAFYSRKLNPAQTRYTTTERELLSIVETLKEFKTILYGQQLNVYTDHANLTYKNFNTDRVLRWRLFLEEYGPILHYIKGEKNVVADALSRLPTDNNHIKQDLESLYMAFESFEQDLNNDFSSHALTYSQLDKAQKKDKSIMKILQQENSLYHLKDFHGGGKTTSLICFKEKIVIPKLLQRHVISWYHTLLCHPGINRTEETIGQHLWWPKMRDQITNYVHSCPTCQRNKRKHKKYGHVPPKEAESIPWDVMCIDLIGPYKIRRKGKNDLVCRCVTMIDPATGWFEMHQYDDKRSITVANIAEQEWFSRYPWPTQVTFDRGKEFIGQDFRRMIKEDYGIKGKPITVRNPQANAIVERIHQVIGNIIRTFELEDNYLDEEDPWKGIISATSFAVRSTYHTTLQKTPGQLVFNRDMIFNIQHAANWKIIKQRKQKLINKNNERENSKRIPHEYKTGDLVLLRRGNENKYESPYSGPHTILQVNDNGTVRMTVGAVTDTYNIRRLTPYHQPSQSNHGGECNMRTSRAKRRKLK